MEMMKWESDFIEKNNSLLGEDKENGRNSRIEGVLRTGKVICFEILCP